MAIPVVTEYDYSINSSTLNHLVNSDRLTLDIGQSSIVTALDHISTGVAAGGTVEGTAPANNGDTCAIFFKDALSSEDITTLTAVMAAHTGAILPQKTVQNVMLTKPDATPAPIASDGRPDFRLTVAKRTTTYTMRSLSFYTSQLASMHNINPVTDGDWGDATYHIYNGNVEITDPLLNNTATKTVIDWEPTYNYEIIGGRVDLPQSLLGGVTDAWFLSVVGVPDYAPVYGGQIKFVSEINLEAVIPQTLTIDGRSINYLAYQYGGAPHTSRIRFIIKHPVGLAKRFQICIEHYV